MQNIKKVNSVIVYPALALFLFFVFLLGRIPGLTLKIGEAMPLLIIPALVALCIFYKEWIGFFYGLFVGFLLDSVTVGSNFLSTFSVMVIAVFAGLMASYVININLKAALVLSLICSLLYYFSNWFFLIALSAEQYKLYYLLKISLPGAVYTSVFIIPFFYLFKWFYKCCNR